MLNKKIQLVMWALVGNSCVYSSAVCLINTFDIIRYRKSHILVSRCKSSTLFLIFQILAKKNYNFLRFL